MKILLKYFNTSIEVCNSNDDCCICLDSCTSNSPIALVCCKNKIHISCLKKLIYNKHVLCPLCRSSINRTINTVFSPFWITVYRLYLNYDTKYFISILFLTVYITTLFSMFIYSKNIKQL